MCVCVCVFRWYLSHAVVLLRFVCVSVNWLVGWLVVRLVHSLVCVVVSFAWAGVGRDARFCAHGMLDCWAHYQQYLKQCLERLGSV